MQLQNQVCAFEQATKLKELGIKQNSLFYWMKYYFNEPPVIYSPKESTSKEFIDKYCFSSFTVAELGLMLGHHKHRIELQNNGRYLCLERGLINAFFYAKDTEAEIRADLLIYLLENHLLKVENINNSLTSK